jgi:hypothetical protein
MQTYDTEMTTDTCFIYFSFPDTYNRPWPIIDAR